MFEVTINKVDSYADNFETLTTGMVNAVFVHFTLSDDWDGMTKVAVFSNGPVTKDILEADWDGTDYCHIPAEVLELPWRTLRVGLKGYLGEELILPATMCCLGRIKPGTNPSGDPATDPELPIWEQLLTRVTTLEGKSNDLCYTTIQKPTPSDEDAPSTVRVSFHGIDSLEGCPELHLYVCQRRRNREHYWRHPANWNTSAATGNTKLGYGLLAGNHYGCHEASPLYPSVPDWMPQNGYLKTEFPLTATDIQRGYIEFVLPDFMLPLLKPVNVSSWNNMGLVGIQGKAKAAPLLFRFLVVKDGNPIGDARDTLCVGLRKEQPSGSIINAITQSGSMIDKQIYSSIR